MFSPGSIQGSSPAARSSFPVNDRIELTGSTNVAVEASNAPENGAAGRPVSGDAKADGDDCPPPSRPPPTRVASAVADLRSRLAGNPPPAWAPPPKPPPPPPPAPSVLWYHAAYPPPPPPGLPWAAGLPPPPSLLLGGAPPGVAPHVSGAGPPVYATAPMPIAAPPPPPAPPLPLVGPLSTSPGSLGAAGTPLSHKRGADGSFRERVERAGSASGATATATSLSTSLGATPQPFLSGPRFGGGPLGGSLSPPAPGGGGLLLLLQACEIGGGGEGPGGPVGRGGRRSGAGAKKAAGKHGAPPARGRASADATRPPGWGIGGESGTRFGPARAGSLGGRASRAPPLSAVGVARGTWGRRGPSALPASAQWHPRRASPAEAGRRSWGRSSGSPCRLPVCRPPCPLDESGRRFPPPPPCLPPPCSCSPPPTRPPVNHFLAEAVTAAAATAAQVPGNGLGTRSGGRPHPSALPTDPHHPPAAPKRRRRQGAELVGPCQQCGTRESPQWRKGPPCKHALCNACGTRWLRFGTVDRDARHGAGGTEGRCRGCGGFNCSGAPSAGGPTVSWGVPGAAPGVGGATAGADDDDEATATAPGVPASRSPALSDEGVGGAATRERPPRPPLIDAGAAEAGAADVAAILGAQASPLSLPPPPPSTAASGAPPPPTPPSPRAAAAAEREAVAVAAAAAHRASVAHATSPRLPGPFSPPLATVSDDRTPALLSRLLSSAGATAPVPSVGSAAAGRLPEPLSPLDTPRDSSFDHATAAHTAVSDRTTEVGAGGGVGHGADVADGGPGGGKGAGAVAGPRRSSLDQPRASAAAAGARPATQGGNFG